MVRWIGNPSGASDAIGPITHVWVRAVRSDSGGVLRAVRRVLTADVAVAPIEKLEHGRHVSRPMHAVADPRGIRRRIGGLRVPMLDQLVVLRAQNGQLGDTTFAIEDTELELVIANQRGAVGASLDSNPRPGGEFVGNLVDEGARMCHGPIVPCPWGDSSAVNVQGFARAQ